jgi:predicted nuclease with RNAse H fold
MNLMAFQCDDLAATVEMMKSNGVRVIETDPTHIMVHPKSTHGILMQLVEKAPDAPRATKAGQVPDTSGVAGIVSYKCTVVFVKDTEAAIKSYEALGLKL